MIIDDEPLVRASILSFSNWEEHNFSFVAEASNGLEALEIINNGTEIDIILLDMHMPKLNGIGFLEQLPQTDFKGGVIVLSANDQYDYVRKSFQLGAIDYILKMDIDEESLLSILKKSSTEVSSRVDKSSVVKKKDLDYMGHKLIIDLLENKNFYNTLTLLDDINIKIEPPLILCSITDPYSEIRKEEQSIPDLITIQGKQFLKKRGKGYFTPINKKEWVCILEVNDNKTPESYCKSFCKDFLSIIYDGLGINLDYFVSYEAEDIKTLPELYKYIKSMERSESRMVRRSKKYIREHYNNSQLSLEEVSTYVEISKNHLSAQFKKEAGITFRDYVMKVRVNEAKKLLTDTNLKVYEISEAVGYPNVEHFSRIFKKVTNTTPNKYSKNRAL